MTRQRGLSFLVAALVAVATALATASASVATSAVPETPGGLSTAVGVDGVTLGWWRGSTTTGGAPTSYVVHRRAPGYDADFVVPTDPTSALWSYGDGSAPVDVEVTYTVTARNSAGDSADSAPVTARVPVWSGPYTPDRVSLTLVWDEAAGGDDTQRSTVVAGSTSTPPLIKEQGNGGVSFSAGSWRRALVIPRGVSDGTYTVGSGEGQLPIRAMAGDFCGPAGAGASAPGGTAIVSRVAPSMDSLYASISVDATLECENGHRLRAELRWHTPEPVRVLSTPRLSVLTAAPGQATTGTITVTNSGSEPIELGAARFVDADMSTSAPLTVAASTCAGLALAAGATCSLSVSYAAGVAGSREGRGVLVLATDVGEWELGTVVGQQPPAYSGPQAFAASTSPGRMDLSWQAPATLDSRLIAGWRVEDVSGAVPVVLETRRENYATATTLPAPPSGTHALRLVLLTTDGREVPSAAVRVTSASRWLLVTTPAGVRAYDADGGVTNGGLLGGRARATDGIATSPTRKAIIVVDGLGAGGNVRVLGPSGKELAWLTAYRDYPDTEPDVSPDGSKAVLLRQEPPATTLITVPMAGGDAVKVPNSEGLLNPVWTPDGSELIASTDTGPLVRVNPATGARTPVPGTTGAYAAAVSRTGRLAYALTGWGGSGQVRVTTLAGGASTLVGTHEGATDLSWDPTGGWLAVTGAYWGNTQTTRLFDLRSATPVLARQFPGGTSVSWLVPNSTAPLSSLAGSAWTTAATTLTVGATDADDAPGGLRRECQLDGGAWTPCSATWKLTGLTAGRHTAGARVTDPSGQRSTVAQRAWSVDTQAPSLSLSALPSALTSTMLKLGWTAKDTGGSGVGSVEVRYRSAPLNTRFGALTYPTAWRTLKGTSLTITLSAGRQYCFSARARDVAGNTGAWSGERCTAVALDDRSLTASTGWTRGTSSAYAYGTYTRAATTGRTLTRTSVQARRIGLVVTTCATCGAVDVYHAGVKLGRVSLYSATTSYRQIRWLPLLTVTRTGNVVIKTTSAKAALIDGLVVWH